MTSAKPASGVVTASGGFLMLRGGWLIFANVYRGMGWGFSQFYIAGSILIESLYDRVVFEEFANRELKPLGVNYFPPYVRPAVFALPLGTLAPLPSLSLGVRSSSRSISAT